MPNSIYKISVIIPVKNGAATLEKCLQSICEQDLDNKPEIIVLDSASEDDSKMICLKYGVQLMDVPEGTFNHGLTRNAGAAAATGDLLWFTVQDAYIKEKDMLRTMADHFSDAAVAGVTGMQAIPHDNDKNPALWFKRSSDPEVKKINIDKDLFSRMTGKEQIGYCRWDNVNSMYRRSILLQQPFVETNLSEDIIWAKQSFENGRTLVWDPSLVVYHYHHHSFGYHFRVNYAVFYADRKIFGIKPRYPSVFMPSLRRTKTILQRKEFSFGKKIGWIFHNAGIFSADILSVFIFRACLFFGGSRLSDRSLKFFCSKIPQGRLR